MFSKKNLEGPSDIGCKLWDWENLECLECSSRWTFSDDKENKRCIPVSDECKNHDEKG